MYRLGPIVVPTAVLTLASSCPLLEPFLTGQGVPPPELRGSYTISPRDIQAREGETIQITAAVTAENLEDPDRVRVDVEIRPSGFITELTGSAVTGAPAVDFEDLTEPGSTDNLYGYTFKPSGNGQTDTHTLHFTCGTGAGIVLVRPNLVSRRVGTLDDTHTPDPNDIRLDGEVRILCLPPEEPPETSAYRVQMVEVAVEDGNAVPVYLPTIADRRVIYRQHTAVPGGIDVQEVRVFDPDSGLDVALHPSDGHTILNLDGMTTPPVANSQDPCGQGGWVPLAGNMERKETGDKGERLVRIRTDGALSQLVAHENMAAPMAGGPDPRFWLFYDPVVDSCGNVVFFASLLGAQTTDVDSIWRQTAGGLQLLVLEHRALPGLDDGWRFGGRATSIPFATRTFVHIPDIRIGASERRSGIWEVSNLGEVNCVAVSGGSTACNSSGFEDVLSPSIGDEGDIAAFAVETADGLRNVIASASGVETVDFSTRKPDDAADITILTSSRSPIACNTDGRIYFTAAFTGNDPAAFPDGLFRYRPGNGTLTTLARTDQLPEVPPPVSGMGLYAALNRRCQFALLGGSPGRAIWVSDPNGVIHQVARIGQQIDVNGTMKTVTVVDMATGGNGVDGRPQSIDADGNVALAVTFQDNTRGFYLARLVAAE